MVSSRKHETTPLTHNYQKWNIFTNLATLAMTPSYSFAKLKKIIDNTATIENNYKFVMQLIDCRYVYMKVY